MLAYHFLKDNMKASNGSEGPWTIGETRAIKDVERIELCKYGYHSSPTLYDALNYAPGPIACLVEVSESLGFDSDPTPKRRKSGVTARSTNKKNVHAQRTLIKAVNIDKELRLFAASCAQHVLYIFEKRHPNDLRPRKAIQAARDYIHGKTSRKDLDAALDNVYAAYYIAATCAASYAATCAARDVHAASAAVNVARIAANIFKGYTFKEIAYVAEREWQHKQFEARFEGLFA